MSKYFEEYGFSVAAIIAGCIALNIVYYAFLNKDSSFVMFVHNLLEVLM